MKKKYEKENEYVVEKVEIIEALNSGGESADEEMKNLINKDVENDIMKKFNPKAGKFILEFLIELDKEINKFFVFYQSHEKEIYNEINKDVSDFTKK